MGRWIEEFPGNMTWSNSALICKGMAPYGCVALGEIDIVCERLRERQAEPDAWREEWERMAAGLEVRGEASQAAGHWMTAGNFYLRAGMYYFTAERFVEPGPQKRELGRKSLEFQGKGLQRRYPNIERVEVPYEGSSLPAWFLRAPGVTGPAPTVVVFDGMDNCKEMSVLFWNSPTAAGTRSRSTARARASRCACVTCLRVTITKCPALRPMISWQRVPMSIRRGWW